MSCHCEEPKATKQSNRRDCFAALAMTFGLVLFFAVNVFAAPSSTLFADANAKYRQSDFKGAFEAYQKIVQTGRGSLQETFFGTNRPLAP